MFCNGKCKDNDKKCGLFIKRTVQDKDQNIKEDEMCVFTALLLSSSAGEFQRERQHAAENSTRNEIASRLDNIGLAQNRWLKNIRNTLAIGMVGIVKKRKFFNKKISDSTIKRLTNGE